MGGLFDLKDESSLCVCHGSDWSNTYKFSIDNRNARTRHCRGLDNHIITDNTNERLDHLDLLLNEAQRLGGEGIVTDLACSIDGGRVVSCIHFNMRLKGD